MCTFEPSIRSLKSIGTDLERAIFNGFASQITDHRLFLCALHLQKIDKRKLQQLVPKKGSETINQILRLPVWYYKGVWFGRFERSERS